jgi:Phospholipase_D-nuclease N-terminal
MEFWDWFFIFLIYVPLVMLWAFTLLDIFRREDLHGGGKALWVAVVFLLPFFGTLIYLVARPPGPGWKERAST